MWVLSFLACFFFLNRKFSEIVQEGVAERPFSAFRRFENNHLATRGRKEEVFLDPDFGSLAVVVSLEIGVRLGHGGIDVMLGTVIDHLEIGIAVAFHHKEELRKLGSQAVTNLSKELFGAGRSREILRLHHVPSAPAEEGQDRKCQDKKLGSYHSHVTLPCPGENCKMVIPKRTGETDLDGRTEAFKGKSIDEIRNLEALWQVFVDPVLNSGKEEARFSGFERFLNPFRDESISLDKESRPEGARLLDGLFFLFRIAHRRQFLDESIFFDKQLGVFRPFEMSPLFNEFENDLVVFTSKP